MCFKCCLCISSWVEGHDPIDIPRSFKGGGCLFSVKPINKRYLLFRTFVAIYASVGFIWSILKRVPDDTVEYWLIYYSNLSLAGIMLYFYMSLLLTYKIYNLYETNRESNFYIESNINVVDDPSGPTSPVTSASGSQQQDVSNTKGRSVQLILEMEDMPQNVQTMYHFTMILVSIVISSRIFVVVAFWLYWDVLSAEDVHAHGVGLFLLLIDYITSCWQFNYKSFILSWLTIVIYNIWQYSFYALNFRNEYDGERYIYEQFYYKYVGQTILNVSFILWSLLGFQLILVFGKKQLVKRYYKGNYTCNGNPENDIVGTNDPKGNQSIELAVDD